jgi:uncharacterized coiled-coil protein SlyX
VGWDAKPKPTRLTPDDAREAEIRRFLVNYDPHSDLPFIMGRLDAVRAGQKADRESFQSASDFLKADLAAAQARLAEQEQTVARLRVDFAAEQRILDERDKDVARYANSFEEAQRKWTRAEATLAAIRTSLEILAAENESFHAQATAKGEYPAQTHFAGKLQIIRNLQTLLDAKPVVTEDPRLAAIRAYVTDCWNLYAAAHTRDGAVHIDDREGRRLYDVLALLDAKETR